MAPNEVSEEATAVLNRLQANPVNAQGYGLTVRHLLHDGEPPGTDPHAVVVWGLGANTPGYPICHTYFAESAALLSTEMAPCSFTTSIDRESHRDTRKPVPWRAEGGQTDSRSSAGNRSSSHPRCSRRSL